MGKSAEKKARQLGKPVGHRPHKDDQQHPTGASSYAKKMGRSAAYLEELLAGAAATPPEKPQASAVASAPAGQAPLNGLNGHASHVSEIHVAPAAPVNSAKPLDLTSASPDQLVEAWQARVKGGNFLHFHSSWETKFKRLLCDTLDSPEVREAIANRETLPQTLPVLLGDVLLRRAVDTNRERSFGGGTAHDFMLNDEGNAGYTLKSNVADVVEKFARECVGIHRPFAGRMAMRARRLSTAADSTCNLGDIDTRRAYTQHCIAYANHVELPDCAQNPSRTLAFKAALKHAIANIDGIATINLQDNSDRMRIAGKLMHGVRGSALHHLRKGDAPELDYAGLLASNYGLYSDVSSATGQFVNFTAREFLNERGRSKGNGAAQRG